MAGSSGFFLHTRSKEMSVADKRMLIIDADIAERIDENRGDMSYSEFLDFLIDRQLKEPTGNSSYVDKDEFNHFTAGIYVDKEEFNQFAAGMKELLRNFLEFFLSYGLELGKQPQDKTFQELSQKLQTLDSAGKNNDH
jgi:hypothetical protein